MKIYLFALFIVLYFNACGTDNNSTNYTTEYYDYYEIVNDNIVYTSINDDIGNYAGIINGFSNTNDAVTIHTVEINDYNLTNTALDINETFNAQKFTQYNATTNKNMSIVYKNDYGKYELIVDYCLINNALNDCKTYIYIRH